DEFTETTSCKPTDQSPGPPRYCHSGDRCRTSWLRRSFTTTPTQRSFADYSLLPTEWGWATVLYRTEGGVLRGGRPRGRGRQLCEWAGFVGRRGRKRVAGWLVRRPTGPDRC